ncbi:hypothetical protein LIS77_03005 [Cytobacillus firmus]|uniref:hypothetical protein n=1 Tax=Cytobacillus firmus TaxID=1399 RepID=UPI00207ABF86|nr:hypothetical protein [Cytobacillus firmus]USK39517.1 hypothetical protein LIS77_03005 [Cytobacillus firmus]
MLTRENINWGCKLHRVQHPLIRYINIRVYELANLYAMSVREMQKSKHWVKLSFWGFVPLIEGVVILKTKDDKKEVSRKNLLYGIGLFIFGGMALTNVTTPLPSKEETKEFLLFILGCALIYYLLVSIYYLGGFWRKVFYIMLILLCGVSISMAFYLATNSIAH